MKKLTTLIIIASLWGTAYGQWQNSPFFDTNILRDYAHTQDLLKQEGFVEGFFPAQDNLSLNYLWLKRPNAHCSVICSAGFFPGRKEGIATFFALLPDDCNILFYDARGHGKSHGALFAKIHRYSQTEYKDVLGAIAWVEKQDSCPIILYGICAGAYHSAHALVKDKKARVAGMIFDSGWAHVESAAHNTIKSECTKRTEYFLKTLGKDSRLIQTLIDAARKGNSMATSILNYTLIQPVLSFQPNLDLLEHIHTIKMPILYIHSYDDTYTPLAPVRKLAQKSYNSSCWWITEKSKHACHHLIHKEKYRERLHKFIDWCIPCSQFGPNFV